jgi:hypothetical protein
MIEYELEYQIVTVSQLFSSNIFKAIDNLEEIFDREHGHHGKAFKYNWPPCTDWQNLQGFGLGRAEANGREAESSLGCFCFECNRTACFKNAKKILNPTFTLT